MRWEVEQALLGTTGVSSVHVNGQVAFSGMNEGWNQTCSCLKWARGYFQL